MYASTRAKFELNWLGELYIRYIRSTPQLSSYWKRNKHAVMQEIENHHALVLWVKKQNGECLAELLHNLNGCEMLNQTR